MIFVIANFCFLISSYIFHIVYWLNIFTKLLRVLDSNDVSMHLP